MKAGRFILMVGLVGAVAGVIVFVIGRWWIASLLISVLAGGATAIAVPLLLVLLYYPRLAGRHPGSGEQERNN